MKKILSLVLVIALVLGSFSFAFATTTPSDVIGTDFETEVETLMALGVIDGYTDGTFKPEKVVTRAELAKLLIVELGYADLTGGAANFSDTAGHWAEGYIALASGLGLVNGYPDGTFKPDNTVSFDEAITMVLRGLGYSDAALTGTWPTNYKIKALNIDLLDDVNVSAAGADRGNIAMMLYNMLFLAYGEVDADDVWQANEDGKDGKDVVAKLVIDKIGDLKTEQFISYEDVYDEDDALDTIVDLEPYLYHIVDYYENADDEVAYIDDVHTVELVLDEVTGWNDDYTGDDADDDSYTVDVDSSDPVMYNYSDSITSGAFTNGALSGAALVAIYLDEDGMVDWADGNDDGDFDKSELIAVIATMINDTVLVQSDYDKWDDDINATTDIQLPVDDDEDFDEDDVIEVYEPWDYDFEDDDLTLVVTRDSVTGDIEEYDGSDSIVIDGVELDYADAFADSYMSNSDLGDEYTAFLNSDGEIVFLDLVVGTKTAEDFAVIVGIADGTVSEAWGDVDVDDAPQIKLLTADGDIVIYDVDVDLDFELSSDSDNLGDLDLDWDGQTGPDTYADIVLSGVEVGDIVLYDLNSDGDIKEIAIPEGSYDDDFERMTAKDDDYDEPVLDGGYLVEDTTVVFDLTDSDSDDWEVINMDQIDMGTSGEVVYVTEADDNEVLVMSVDDNDTTTTTDIYAIITKVTMTIDGDDVIQKLVGFFDGEEDVMYTDDEDDFDDDYIDEYLMALEIDGEVETTTVEAVDFEGIIDNINGDFVKVGGSYYEVDEEVVVYEITFEDDGDVDEIMVIDYDDVDEDGYAKLFDTDNDKDGDDDEIDVIIYVQEKDVDESGYTK